MCVDDSLLGYLGIFWRTSATSSDFSPFRSGALVFGLFSSATNLDHKARWGAQRSVVMLLLMKEKHRRHESVVIQGQVELELDLEL